ncbi:hypothetical protein [Bradyrhizobium ottawaense]|uniref:hypothetical protein n=1 Tax=Bradyrhizobium ottawaense TaxID=931866 RepID=UPI002A047E47
MSGVLVYCHCGHHVAINADSWPDEMRLSDLEPRFVCQGCGARGADIRPDFDRGDGRLAIVGYRTIDQLRSKSEVQTDNKTDGEEGINGDDCRRTKREKDSPSLVQPTPRTDKTPVAAPASGRGHDDAGASGQAPASWD